MTPPTKNRMTARREHGAAAIELAVFLPVLIFLFAICLLATRYLWHYTVAQKAAHDAARFMSTIGPQEMLERELFNDAAAVAQEIARAELAELAPGAVDPIVVVECETRDCYSSIGNSPDAIRVYVTMSLSDTFLRYIDTGRYGWPIAVTARIRHVGR